MSFVLASQELSQRASGRVSFFFGFSMLFHGVVFVGLPLLLGMFHKPKVFERQPTFQLIRPMVPAAPVSPSRVSKKVVQKPTEAKQAIPAKKKMREATNINEAKVEENLDELSDLLGEVAAPSVLLSATGDFKYAWYVNAIETKIRGNWNPPVRQKELSVVVAFTILSNGSLGASSIGTSSGVAVFDNAALRAVQLASPFGRLPGGFSGSEAQFAVTLFAEER